MINCSFFTFSSSILRCWNKSSVTWALVARTTDLQEAFFLAQVPLGIIFKADWHPPPIPLSSHRKTFARLRFRSIIWLHEWLLQIGHVSGVALRVSEDLMPMPRGRAVLWLPPWSLVTLQIKCPAMQRIKQENWEQMPFRKPRRCLYVCILWGSVCSEAKQSMFQCCQFSFFCDDFHPVLTGDG